MKGGDAVQPPFSDSVLNVDGTFRQSMLAEGAALRFNIFTSYSQESLRAPSNPDAQQYTGQYPFETEVLTGIFSADLHQLGLRHTQLDIAGMWDWASWRTDGPKKLGIWQLYLYKEFGNDRVELKAGYNSNEFEFVGMQVGGSTTTASAGIFTILPNEVGMAFYPLPAPQLNLRVHGPGRSYAKSGIQRSLDAGGGVAEWARNSTGLRFIPKGDKALLIEEVGWRRSSGPDAGQFWFRSGYMHNSTRFKNFASGKMEPGNHLAYALADAQLTRPDSGRPWRGLYGGLSAMTSASQFNDYARYYEARLYENGPFAKRPTDLVSVISSYSPHSSFLTNRLAAAGQPVWRNSATVSGSYNIHAGAGQYLIFAMTYIHGPAITPRLPDAFTLSATYSVFF